MGVRGGAGGNGGGTTRSSLIKQRTSIFHWEMMDHDIAMARGTMERKVISVCAVGEGTMMGAGTCQKTQWVKVTVWIGVM